MRKLTIDDVKNIEIFSTSHSNLSAFSQPSSYINIDKNKITVKRVNGLKTDWRDIRAEYNNKENNISIHSIGIDLKMVADRCELVTFLTSMIVHEATHYITRNNFTKNEIDESVRGNKKASASKSCIDYFSYINHPVEIIAHEAMIASDVYRSIGFRRTWWAFWRAALKSQSLIYIRSRLKGMGWLHTWRFAIHIINNAWTIYSDWR